MNFPKNTVNKSGQSTEKNELHIAQLSGQTFKITGFNTFWVASENTDLKTSNFKSLTRKPNYSSFFSEFYPNLKNVFFGKIH